MKIKCIRCSGEVNLDHKIFQNYAGPVKCFRCGAMMDIKTEQGSVSLLAPSRPEDKEPKRKVSRQRV